MHRPARTHFWIVCCFLSAFDFWTLRSLSLCLSLSLSLYIYMYICLSFFRSFFLSFFHSLSLFKELIGLLMEGLAGVLAL